MFAQKGFYVVVEGQDGTGKTTQINLLANHFRKQNRAVAILNEGSRDESGLTATNRICEIIKTSDYNLDPLTNVALFTAQRRELWTKLAEPILNDNGIVISARNWWSTLAFQHYGQNVDKEKITRITEEIMPKRYTKPDAAVILTLDDAGREKRMHSRDDTSAKDTFESQPDDFQARVNNGYLEIAKQYNLPIIDASGTIKEVSSRIRSTLDV